MKFSTAIDDYLRDSRDWGRINSPGTEHSYLHVLSCHAEDCGARGPLMTDREDVKLTLRRWPNPNTQRVHRSILVSFYDWMVEEGHRPDNPARATPRAKRRPTSVYRLTRDEVVAMAQAASDARERRAIYLGLFAGLRNAEMRGLKGRHFARPDFIHVSNDIAKGKRERFVPVLPDLEPVVEEIRAHVGADEYVLPAQRWRDGRTNSEKMDLKTRPSSSQALRSLVMRVGERAGIHAHIHPHLLRHAFGDHIAKYAGMRNAQFLLGHATIGTTETYTGRPTLDELTASVRGLQFVTTDPTPQISSNGGTPIEPVNRASLSFKELVEYKEES